VIFIVSDFMADDDPLTSRELGQLAAKHDVIGIVPEEPSETTLPAGSGYLRVKDVESGRRWSLGLGKRARARYEASTRERRDALSRAFYRVPMDHVFVPTDKSPVLPVLSMFARRMSA